MTWNGRKSLKDEQAGTTTINITALNTVYSTSVTFTVPFDAAPSVTANFQNGSPNLLTPVGVDATATTATFYVMRTGGSTGNLVVHWQAKAKTQ